MNHPLNGARLKVVRAQEHLDSLKSEIRMYLDEQPKEFLSQPAPHPYPWMTTTNHVLAPIVPPVTPLRFSTIIGDCVTNARAALDYIVWQLAIRYFDPPLSKRDRFWVSWPALEHRVDHVAKIKGLAKRKIPARALGHINRSHHAYAGYQAFNWLRILVNDDKHRMPVLTVGDYPYMSIELAPNPTMRLLNMGPAMLVIPRNRTTEGSPGTVSDMPMKAQVPIYVTFQDVAMPREPVERTLEQIIETVANIIPRFDGFF